MHDNDHDNDRNMKKKFQFSVSVTIHSDVISTSVWSIPDPFTETYR